MTSKFYQLLLATMLCIALAPGAYAKGGHGNGDKHHDNDRHADRDHDRDHDGDHDRDDRAATFLALGTASLRRRAAGLRRARVPLAWPADGGLVDVAAVGVDQRPRGPGPGRPRKHARLAHPVGIGLGHRIRLFSPAPGLRRGQSPSRSG